jgi:hypothetical protein
MIHFVGIGDAMVLNLGSNPNLIAISYPNAQAPIRSFFELK